MLVDINKTDSLLAEIFSCTNTAVHLCHLREMTAKPKQKNSGTRTQKEECKGSSRKSTIYKTRDRYENLKDGKENEVDLLEASPIALELIRCKIWIPV